MLTQHTEAGFIERNHIAVLLLSHFLPKRKNSLKTDSISCHASREELPSVAGWNGANI